MPINKDLSVSPYFDDFSDDKNFYKVLFKPKTAVQVRELNQLQTILQNQIEKFGNNIYKRGTIIDGVNFIYHDSYPYIKISDSQLDGIPAAPALYVSNFAVDPVTNLTAHIINSQDGYESTDPDLKTLYLRYINSGISGIETSFTPGASLTVYDYLNSVNKVVITNGSSGFSNNDAVVFCSALSVNVSSTAAFTVGETITQAGNTHIAIIDSIATVDGKKVLKIRPRQTDLTNTAISATIWEFTPGLDIVGSVSNATGNVLERIGDGAKASAITSADIGKIASINISARGSGYYVTPYVTIKSSGVSNAIGARNYTDLGLSGRNYIAQLTVSTKANSVGSGYAFSVTSGVIYQKGYFVSVNDQTVIVDKYSPLPDQVSIGFDSVENIVDSNNDQSLLDNSSGTRNEFAPGADRLNLEPRLVVLNSDDASANNEFFSIVEFSEGYPYRENKRTQFNSIMDEMAIRTNEQSGNFVLDQFLVTTSSSTDQALEGQKFAAVIDPGKGYIDGYRVETQTNYYKNVDKGIDSRSASNLAASISYGNYILVNEMVGVISFASAPVIRLFDTAGTKLSNSASLAAYALTGSGNQIGTARVRNVVYDSGEVGTSTALYRVYLFDINMNSSRGFSEVRSIQYDGTNKGMADVALTYDATSNTNICKLMDVSSGTSLLIDTGSDATNNLTNLTYVYRTVNEALQLQSSGNITALLSDPSESFAYNSASLTDNDIKEIIITPLADIFTTYGGVGTVNVSTASNTVVFSVAAEANKYAIGDFISISASGTGYIYRRVTGKSANTIIVDTNVGLTAAAGFAARAYPKGVPVSLDRVTGGTATLSGGNKTMTISIGATTADSAPVNVAVTYDVKVTNTTPTAKVPQRNLFVKIALGTNTGYLNGPWCLGHPDVFRLRAVYLGNSSSVDTTGTDVTDQFYIDHNQTADYYGLSYLYKRNDANINLNANTYLLVQFDAFTASAGVYTVNSYVSANTAQRFVDDSLTLANLGNKVNSFEIPELNITNGTHFDLINCIDFRPYVANTAVRAITAAAASVNPAETISYGTGAKKFPLPDTAVSFDRSYFLGRKDIVVINNSNKINVIRGVPGESQPYADPVVPNNTIILKKLVIPSYPCVPEKFSSETLKILDKKMSSERLMIKRIRDKTIKSETSNTDIALAQPKVYTMSDIGKLERRIGDIEYSVALSLVESELKDKVIPSSVNPSLNRFKFGFYVDNYDSKKNSEVDNLEYQADVIDGKVVPITESTLMTHGHGYRIASPMSSITLVNQDLASEPPPPPAPPPPPPTLPPVVVTPAPVIEAPVVAEPVPAPPAPAPVVVPPPVVVTPIAPVVPVKVVTAKAVSVFRSEKSTTSKKYDELVVTMSSVASSFSVAYQFWSGKDALAVVKLHNDGTEEFLFSGNLTKSGTKYFNHNPATGNRYAFRVIIKSGSWQYTVNYSVDDVTYTVPAAPEVNLSTLTYTGKVNTLTPGYISAQSLGQNFNALSYISAGSTQQVSISGLKPRTLHYVTMSDYSAKVVVNPTLTAGTGVGSGSTVTSDEYGTVNFSMNIDASTVNDVNNLVAQSASATTLATTILCQVRSPDNQSLASFYLTTKTEAKAMSPILVNKLSDNGLRSGIVGRTAIP
jgi:hypothetical protein